MNKLLYAYACILLTSCNFNWSPAPIISPSPSPSVTVSAQPSTTPSRKSWPINGWQPEYEQVLLDGLKQIPMAYGMSNLCPKWWSVDQKSVWIKLWKGIITCECDFNRTSWMEEKMGIDPVTGKTVKSEGLLQLSYQDVPNYNLTACNQISWSKDKNLDVNDPNKTIFDPIINLQCGMAIAKREFETHKDGGKWGTGLGLYWSCARPGERGIEVFKKSAPECFL